MVFEHEAAVENELQAIRIELEKIADTIATLSIFLHKVMSKVENEK